MSSRKVIGIYSGEFNFKGMFFKTIDDWRKQLRAKCKPKSNTKLLNPPNHPQKSELKSKRNQIKFGSVYCENFHKSSK